MRIDRKVAIILAGFLIILAIFTTTGYAISSGFSNNNQDTLKLNKLVTAPPSGIKDSNTGDISDSDTIGKEQIKSGQASGQGKTSASGIAHTAEPSKTAGSTVSPGKLEQTAQPSPTNTVGPSGVVNPTPPVITTPGQTQAQTYAPTSNKPDLICEMFNYNLADKTNSLSPHFRITNSSSTPVDVSRIRIRYYFTINGVKPLNFISDYAAVRGTGAYSDITSHVNGYFAQLTTPTSTSDNFMEVTFDASCGMIPPGGNVIAHVRIEKSDWSEFIQSDDYSFNPSATDFVGWDKFDVIYN